jgi:hypothetical protein
MPAMESWGWMANPLSYIVIHNGLLYVYLKISSERIASPADAPASSFRGIESANTLKTALRIDSEGATAMKSIAILLATATLPLGAQWLNYPDTRTG